MRVNDDYTKCNAEQQLADATSVFNFWHRVLQLRRQHKDIFIYGRFEMVVHDHPSIICYQRICDDGEATVILNFIDDEQEWSPPPSVVAACRNGREILANYPIARDMGCRRLQLRPFEARVILERWSKQTSNER